MSGSVRVPSASGPTGRAVPDQPADWTEPGAYPVSEAVWRIPLPLPQSGLRAVNVYATVGPDGLVLVDGGWASVESLGTLESGLRSLGYALDDVARVVVTHAHHDHYTQAIALRDRHGAAISLGRGEIPSVEALDAETVDVAQPAQPGLLRRAGAPRMADEAQERDRRIRAMVRAPWGRPDHWLDDGQPVALGPRSVEVVATPGHTRGHVVLRDDDAGALFAGDHVLPHITPSIGFERAPEPAPLRSYLASLRLVRDRPDALLLPAHGPVTASVHTRVDELLEHHAQRLDASLALVREGAATAYDVAAGLPWTRRETPLSELEGEHAALAVLEIAAHLDVLADQGLVTPADDEKTGVRSYQPA